MYAIVKVGSQQYRIKEGDEIKIQKFEGEIGRKIELKDVLLMADGEKIIVGQPTVKKEKIIGEIIGQGKEKKIIVFHKRRRKNSKCKQGHRQSFTRLRILEIKQSK
ncbi:50S ribosomal protein L21 [candidate division NPL-UPA2 bacterium]|nr:50S ribosomal protein L21 [candidate division NPL-UPA2 bacterium]